MSLTTICCDTFEALNSDCSLPLVASLQCLIRSVSCGLINMRTLVDSLDCRRIAGATEIYNHNETKSLIPPSEAISETTRKFLDILRQIDQAILNQIISLADLHKRKAMMPASAARETSCLQGPTARTSQAQSLTLQLSRNLKRVSSQLESFVYWADNFLLASLADSARGDLPNDRPQQMNHVQREQTFDVLIDACVDVVQGAWSIRAQLAQARAILNRTRGLTHNHNNRHLLLPSRPRKSRALRSKPILKYELGDSLGRRLRTRSVQKLQPRKPTGVKRSIAWLEILLEPDISLKTIRAARNLLENKS